MKSEQIEALVQKVQAWPDAAARETTLELVQAILDLHAGALDRMMEIIAAAEGGPAIIEALATDARASGILLLHDMHPLDLETRVSRALDSPMFSSGGASVELIGLQDGIIRVRVEGGAGLKQSVEKALWEAAPEAVEVLVEGGPGRVSNNFVPLEALLTG